MSARVLRDGAAFQAIVLVLWGLCSSCRGPRAHESQPTAANTKLTRVYLDEPFALGPTVRCGVNSARLVATEPAHGLEPQRVAEDLLVVDVALACTDAKGRALEKSEVLPDDAVVLLRDAGGKKRAPSLRTKQSARAPGHWTFEVSASEDVLLRPRRFDAETGEPEGRRERGTGVLAIEFAGRRVEVMLRARVHDAALDRAVERVARALSRHKPDPALSRDDKGARAFAQLSSLYAGFMARFSARSLELAGVRELEGRVRVTWLLDGSRLRDAPSPLTRFELELERDARGELYVTELVDPVRVRSALECADARLSLSQRVERAYQRGPARAECNALGVLVPCACDETCGGLIADAVAVGGRCPEGPLERLRDARAAPSADFQLTLRRGTSGVGLDRHPRYVLALFANGSVVFHGRHWVSSTGRSDGRTHVRWVAGLERWLVELGWFERRGGQWAKEACSPERELGNVLTLHAGGRERMVLDRDGCRGPFSGRELAQVVEVVEAVAGVSAWTRPRPGYADPGLEVWTIAAE